MNAWGLISVNSKLILGKAKEDFTIKFPILPILNGTIQLRRYLTESSSWSD